MVCVRLLVPLIFQLLLFWLHHGDASESTLNVTYVPEVQLTASHIPAPALYFEAVWSCHSWELDYNMAPGMAMSFDNGETNDADPSFAGSRPSVLETLMDVSVTHDGKSAEKELNFTLACRDGCTRYMTNAYSPSQVANELSSTVTAFRVPVVMSADSTLVVLEDVLVEEQIDGILTGAPCDVPFTGGLADETLASTGTLVATLHSFEETFNATTKSVLLDVESGCAAECALENPCGLDISLNHWKEQVAAVVDQISTDSKVFVTSSDTDFLDVMAAGGYNIVYQFATSQQNFTEWLSTHFNSTTDVAVLLGSSTVEDWDLDWLRDVERSGTVRSLTTIIEGAASEQAVLDTISAQGNHYQLVEADVVDNSTLVLNTCQAELNQTRVDGSYNLLFDVDLPSTLIECPQNVISDEVFPCDIFVRNAYGMMTEASPDDFTFDLSHPEGNTIVDGPHSTDEGTFYVMLVMTVPGSQNMTVNFYDAVFTTTVSVSNLTADVDLSATTLDCPAVAYEEHEVVCVLGIRDEFGVLVERLGLEDFNTSVTMVGSNSTVQWNITETEKEEYEASGEFDISILPSEEGEINVVVDLSSYNATSSIEVLQDPGELDFERSDVVCTSPIKHAVGSCEISLVSESGSSFPFAVDEDFELILPSIIDAWGLEVDNEIVTFNFMSGVDVLEEITIVYNGTIEKSFDVKIYPTPGGIEPTNTIFFCEPNPVIAGLEVICTIVTRDSDNVPAHGATASNFTLTLSGSFTDLTDIHGTGSDFVFSFKTVETGFISVSVLYGGSNVFGSVFVSPEPGVIDPSKTRLECSPNPVTVGKEVSCVISTFDVASIASFGATRWDFDAILLENDGMNITTLDVTGSGSTFVLSFEAKAVGITEILVDFRNVTLEASVHVNPTPGEIDETHTTISCTPNPAVRGSEVTCVITTNDVDDIAASGASLEDFEITGVDDLTIQGSGSEFIIVFTVSEGDLAPLNITFRGFSFTSLVSIVDAAGNIEPSRTLLVCEPNPVTVGSKIECEITTRDAGGNRVDGASVDEFSVSLAGMVQTDTLSEVTAKRDTFSFDFYASWDGVAIIDVTFRNETTSDTVTINELPEAIVPEHTIISCSPSPVEVEEEIICSIYTHGDFFEPAVGATVNDFYVETSREVEMSEISGSGSSFEFSLVALETGDLSIFVSFGGVRFRVSVPVIVSNEGFNLNVDDDGSSDGGKIALIVVLSLTVTIFGGIAFWKRKDIRRKLKEYGHLQESPFRRNSEVNSSTAPTWQTPQRDVSNVGSLPYASNGNANGDSHNDNSNNNRSVRFEEPTHSEMTDNNDVTEAAVTARSTSEDYMADMNGIHPVVRS